MKAFIKRHRLVVFFILAFALSWYPWVFALLRGQTTGPNPLGPFVAGISVTAIISGRIGLRQFFGRLGRWRFGTGWYAIIFATPILLCLCACLITIGLLPEAHVPTLPIERLREVPERFIFILLFIGLGEEPGWRGFALPELQTKRSPLRASFILAPIWALWHLPLMGNEFSWPIVPAFIVSVFGATLMLTWIFNRTDGSVLAGMLFHATVNTVGSGLIFPLFPRQALTLLWWVYSFSWLALGLTAIVFDRTNSRAGNGLAVAGRVEAG